MLELEVATADTRADEAVTPHPHHRHLYEVAILNFTHFVSLLPLQ